MFPRAAVGLFLPEQKPGRTARLLYILHVYVPTIPDGYVVACCVIKVAYVFELLNRTTTNEPFARVDEEVLADFVQVLPEYP